MRVVGWLLCVVIVVNLTLFVLTFVPAFSGIEGQPGLADRLWGNYRYDGWRADVAWVVTSTIAILVLGLAYSQSTAVKGTREYKLVVTACALWMVSFVVYARYIFIHMMG